MATRDEICATCDQYIALLAKGDTEGIVTLYDPNARIEDPLGSETKIARIFRGRRGQPEAA